MAKRTEVGEERPRKRTPIGTTQRLVAPKREGYKRRWVNDVDDRIAMFKAAGYEPVAGHLETNSGQLGLDSQMGNTVHKSVGGGQKAVLMEIKEEWYQEDQQAKQKRIDQTEAALVSAKDKQGHYGDIQIGRK